MPVSDIQKITLKKKKRKSELFVYNRRHRLFGAGVYLLQGFVHMTATLNER